MSNLWYLRKRKHLHHKVNRYTVAVQEFRPKHQQIKITFTRKWKICIYILFRPVVSLC